MRIVEVHLVRHGDDVGKRLAENERRRALDMNPGIGFRIAGRDRARYLLDGRAAETIALTQRDRCRAAGIAATGKIAAEGDGGLRALRRCLTSRDAEALIKIVRAV